MDPVDWQRTLRRQFGEQQDFTLTPLGDDAPFGDWLVGNPASASQHRVAIRGLKPGDNFCACADYATNGLGTCKHIEFALSRLQRRRGARAAFARGHTPAFSEVWLHYAEQRILQFSAGTTCPAALQRLANRYFQSAEGGLRWTGADLSAFDGFARKAARAAAAAGHELKVHEDVITFVAQDRDARHRAHVLAQAYPRGPRDKSLSRLLKARLYPYQVEGALFAARTGRALLGDEMGLGKTVQAIAAAELMSRHFGVQRVLVVCPTSLKHQWKNEFERFAGRSVQVLGGPRAVRQVQWRDDATCKVVNYETLLRDTDQALLWAPDLLIIDEAQRVKNWNTRAAIALRRMATPAVCPNVLVLTGTPLENRLEELLAIVQLVDQQALGPTWRLLHDHQRRDEAGRVVGYRDLDRIGARLAPLLLRRRKREVLAQLPERVDKTLFVTLTPEQRAHHDEHALTVRRIVQRWQRSRYLSDADQRRLQCALQNMRMVCNSTWLLDHETDHGDKADELVTLLDELLQDPASKAVVFSQWVGTHEVLMRRLRTRGWGHVFFHGGVPAEQRGALVKRFHDEENCRVFLSTDAGGTGLNLQHAAAVIVNMDLPWNPAVLEQRIGRVHRIGQRRGVQVVNLVAEASIEHNMLSVLAFKKSLFEGVLDGGEASVFLEGGRLSRFMQAVGQVAQGLEAASDVASESDLTGPNERRSSVPIAPSDDWEQEGQSASETLQVPMHDPQPDVAGATAVSTGAAKASPAAAPGSGADPWAPLLHAGLQLLEALTESRPSIADVPGAAASLPQLQVDPRTGERYMRVPLPDPKTLHALAERLGQWLGASRQTVD